MRNRKRRTRRSSPTATIVLRRFASYFFHLCFPEQSGGPEKENQDENGESDSVAIIGNGRHSTGECFEQAKHQATERSARQVSNASDYCSNERAESRLHTHERLDAGRFQCVENSRYRCERRAEAKCEGYDAIATDA